jgi:hypothetical protein
MVVLVDEEYVAYLTRLTRSADSVLREQAYAELMKVGPKGYEHGWHFVGVPVVGALVQHPTHGHGRVIRAGKKTSAVKFTSGHEAAFEHGAAGPSDMHFVSRAASNMAKKRPVTNSEHRLAADAQVQTDRMGSAPKPRAERPVPTTEHDTAVRDAARRYQAGEISADELAATATEQGRLRQEAQDQAAGRGGGDTVYRTGEAGRLVQEVRPAASTPESPVRGSQADKDQRRAASFAGKWVADVVREGGTAEPTDENLNAAFAHTARPPSPDLYDQIREEITRQTAELPAAIRAGIVHDSPAAREVLARLRDPVGDPKKRAAYMREHANMTRDQFEALGEEGKTTHLTNLRTIAGSEDRRQRAFRDSMGSLIRDGDAEHVGEARNQLNHLLRPEVQLDDRSPAAVVARMRAATTEAGVRAALRGNRAKAPTKADLADIAREGGWHSALSSGLTSDKMTQRILNEAAAHHRTPKVEAPPKPVKAPRKPKMRNGEEVRWNGKTDSENDAADAERLAAAEAKRHADHLVQLDRDAKTHEDAAIHEDQKARGLASRRTMSDARMHAYQEADRHRAQAVELRRQARVLRGEPADLPPPPPKPTVERPRVLPASRALAGPRPRRKGEARRGDLIVVEQRHSQFVQGQGYKESTDLHVGRVTNVTRDGQATAYLRAGDEGAPTQLKNIPHVKTYIQPAETVNVEAALHAAANNPWPHAPQHVGKPYDSLEEAKAAIAPHKITPAPDVPSAAAGPKPKPKPMPSLIPKPRASLAPKAPAEVNYTEPTGLAPGARVTWTHHHEDGTTTQRTGRVWDAAPGTGAAWVIPDERKPTDPYSALVVKPNGRGGKGTLESHDTRNHTTGSLAHAAAEQAHAHRHGPKPMPLGQAGITQHITEAANDLGIPSPLQNRYGTTTSDDATISRILRGFNPYGPAESRMSHEEAVQELRRSAQQATDNLALMDSKEYGKYDSRYEQWQHQQKLHAEAADRIEAAWNRRVAEARAKGSVNKGSMSVEQFTMILRAAEYVVRARALV